jgi:hypothetical protein
VLVLPALLPVTVCAPAVVAVQPLPVHEPFGAIEKVVLDVTSGVVDEGADKGAAFVEGEDVEVLRPVEGDGRDGGGP